MIFHTPQAPSRSTALPLQQRTGGDDVENLLQVRRSAEEENASESRQAQYDLKHIQVSEVG